MKTKQYEKEYDVLKKQFEAAKVDIRCLGSNLANSLMLSYVDKCEPCHSSSSSRFSAMVIAFTHKSGAVKYIK